MSPFRASAPLTPAWRHFDFTVDDGVATLRLNRPEKLNALTFDAYADLRDLLAELPARGDVRVLVIGGEGHGFCSGGDVEEIIGPLQQLGARELLEFTRMTGSVVKALRESPLPVIAAVNGYCYGGGAALAVACDIRLASENATFRLPGVEYGLVVGAATLPRLTGAANAKELIFTARRFDAAEALARGLVNAVYPRAELLPAALAMAEQIAAHSAAAVRAAKRVIDAATLSDAARALEAESNRSLRGSPEQRERFREATRRVTGR